MFKKLIVVLIVAAWGGVTNASTLLPTTQVGDAFAGIFSIDLNTPPNAYPASTMIGYSSPGTFTVLINGGTFSSPATGVTVVPGSDNTWRCYLSASAQPATLNGVHIPVSVMSIILYGDTNSTSIIPLPLSSYSQYDLNNFYRAQISK